MKIKFDTETVTQSEARTVCAMLVGMWGPEIVPASYERVGEVERATGLYVLPENRTGPAPDGYPVAPPPPADNAHVAEGCEPFSTEAPHRDVAGIPWDERIHASTKTTNKDGTWTRRRNTPDEVFDKVMAELKAANTAMTLEAAAGLTAPAPTPEPQAAPSAAEAFTPPASVVIPPAVPVPPVPVAVPQPPAPPVADDKAAEAVEIMKAVNAKQVPQDKLAEIMASAGLKGLGEVFTAPIETRRIVAAALAAL